ncbi:maleylpyruvate isomerase family mycothiol-dependent enzyme [Amycolatopsis orientalis]|uniref:maleylpyruvate isomerase family mycothiol-dependent enzyme n=1 Tax=Amycolatopsis orientalis TaxID=31958 RepID=UPI0003A06AA4|nr:maleylpyruvate isomerase family mycothiol-dependent enzyme [Amycolatopsis orientalis]
MAPAAAQSWVSSGTELFLTHAKELSGPSALPGWTRKHLAAHVAANADALGNLVHWARTGERTPMYASPEQRNADIDAGSRLPEAQLASWLRDSARSLESAMAALTPRQWQNEVVTAQGRTVPATEIPWLRAREVCVHAVDLGTGLSFADLPEAFLSALVAEIQAKRGLDSLPDGPLPDVAAYLAGRPHSLTGVPDLGPWL